MRRVSILNAALPKRIYSDVELYRYFASEIIFYKIEHKESFAHEKLKVGAYRFPETSKKFAFIFTSSLD